MAQRADRTVDAEYRRNILSKQLAYHMLTSASSDWARVSST
jgi:hypothetical protein